MENIKFSDLELSESILKAVEELGFVEATPIQAEAIPAVMSGRDVIGQAQTGTGKTAAFGIPAIEMVDETDPVTQVLILCPTRELALQVKEQIYKLAKYKRDLLVTAIYGGESYEKQFRDLKKGAHIVVGTPGRVMDHMDRKTLKLDSLKMLVLDEADEMLNMGFREDIETVLSHAPEERQTVLFSATMSKDILSITKRFQNDPQLIKVTRKEVTNDNIEQSYFNVRREGKLELMTRLIEVNDLQLMLVFCNTKNRVDEVTADLQALGYAAEGLHGDLRQTARNQVMNKFRHGKIKILVATDVAARGIDVSDVDAVFNYDVPLDIEYYVHRIGRTGRAGKKGQAFLFASGRDRSKLRDLERYTKSPIPEGKIPTKVDLIAARQVRFAAKIKENIKEEGNDVYEELTENLRSEGLTNEQIVVALMRMQLGNFDTQMSDEELMSGGRGGNRRDDDRGGRSRERGGDRDRGGDRGGRGGSERRSGGRREREFSGGGSGGGREHRGGGRTRSNEPMGKSSEEGMARILINLGRKDFVAPNHIVGAIAAESKIPGRAIGNIEIQDNRSYVDIPERDVQKVLNGMRGKTINAKVAKMEVVS
jgi:ATP-dependent RNA helicase DeaD